MYPKGNQAQPRQGDSPPIQTFPPRAPITQLKVNDSRHATVSWDLVHPSDQRPFAESGLRVDHVVIKLDTHAELHHHKSRSKPSSQCKFVRLGSDGKSDSISLQLEQGRRYTATVAAFIKAQTDYTSVLLDDPITFRSAYTPEELGRIFQKATDYLKSKDPPGSFHPLYYFFRDKHDEYFADIFNHRGGVMEVRIKDRNGDPASPINETLKGLFFGVNVSGPEGLPMTPSQFGPSRLLIPAPSLFDITPNVYFTDFYCLKETHYVTLTMTKSGSSADKFCQERLIRLDIANNPFLRYRPMAEVAAAQVTNGVVVEIFCTENINLLSALVGASLVNVNCVGRSWPHGLIKNPNCQICNLPQ